MSTESPPKLEAVNVEIRRFYNQDTNISGLEVRFLDHKTIDEELACKVARAALLQRIEKLEADRTNTHN